eukprot:6142873-Alexandrium_andersonii.AAC.1
MAHRSGSMASSAPSRRQADGSCLLCGAWTCQRLLLGETEDQERALQLGARTFSERAGQPPPPPASFETRLHAHVDDGAMQSR